MDDYARRLSSRYHYLRIYTSTYANIVCIQLYTFYVYKCLCIEALYLYVQ